MTSGALPQLRPTQQEGASPRAKEMLAIAAQLFYRDGYSTVGMRMIAEATGVRPASLYHHFSSKEQMLYHIILEVTRDFIDAKLPLLDGDGPRSDRLEALLREHIVYFWQHRYSMSVGLREMRHLSADHQAEVREHRLRYQHAIRDFIVSGVADGHFISADPPLTALAILDLVNGVNGWFTERGRRTIDDVARHHAQLIVNQLLQLQHP